MNSALIESMIDSRMKSWANFQPERYATDNVNFKPPLGT